MCNVAIHHGGREGEKNKHKNQFISLDTIKMRYGAGGGQITMTQQFTKNIKAQQLIQTTPTPENAAIGNQWVKNKSYLLSKNYCSC